MMPSPVKNTSAKTLPPCSSAWLIYFLISIAFLGSLMAFGICVPLYLLSRFLPNLEARADQIMCRGIHLLLRLQPWLRSEIALDLPMLPGRGYLLISNHRSHLDTFILLAHICGLRILAKKSLFAIPFLGVMMILSRQIPTARGRVDSFMQALQLIRVRLRLGERVHIFAEMSRCPAGFAGGTQNFSLAPFLIAHQENILIIPIVFRDTDLVWPKGVFGLSYRQPIQVRALEVIDPSQFASAELLKNAVQQRINEALK